MNRLSIHRSAARFIRSAAIALIAAAGSAQAADVLLLSSGDADIDGTAQTLLESAGHRVTVGAQYWELTGSEALSGYDAILVLAGPNWASGTLFTDDAQQMIVDYVQGGGGLVTTEWITWNADVRAWTVLPEILPADIEGFTNDDPITYTQEGADPSLFSNLPTSFSFAADNFAGSNANLTAKPEARVFYTTDAGYAGVVGWDAGDGRTISLSTPTGLNQLDDPNYRQLLLNAVEWADDCGDAPPACIADLTGSSDPNDPSYGRPDGSIDADDFFYFLDAFAAGCS